jgi:methylenetetrahydrofolate dehydrogenase (NADP+) / methenyltetrahydrofolate cyclohydrolase
MTAIRMDGKTLASEIEDKLKSQAAAMKSSGVNPTLATIIVGDDPASKIYVASKHKAAGRIGIATTSHTLPADTPAEELTSLIDRLNSDPQVSGILLQLPLPPHLDERQMIERIDPAKDVDGLTSTNAGRLFYGASDLVPCTPRGVMELLHRYQVRIASSTCVIVNRSRLVGKPLYHLLLNEDATVTTCHSRSTDLASIMRRADILITAVGRRPQFVVKGDMVKEGAVVVDVAMNRLDGKLVGDADYEDVSRKASHITPVPGGVGPMTVVMLMQNTLTAAAKNWGVLSKVTRA